MLLLLGELFFETPTGVRKERSQIAPCSEDIDWQGLQFALLRPNLLSCKITGSDHNTLLYVLFPVRTPVGSYPLARRHLLGKRLGPPRSGHRQSG